MSSNNQPLSGNSFTPIQRSSLNSLITSIILDSDTGDSSFLIRTGNNSSFYIDKFSNVGINTTSPGTQLEVASANGSCLRLRYGATSALANIYVSSGGNLSLNPSGGELNTNGNFNITAHNGSTSGLLLNGTLVLSSAAQLNYVTVTAGTASASKAVVLDSNRDITNIRYLTASQLTGTIQTAAQPNITSVGTLTSLTVGNIEVTGTLTVSGGSINTALGYLTEVTPGTALASKALILDSSSNVTGISGLGTTSITIGGNTIGATQSAYLTSITAGTAAASKALIVDGSRDITNIRYLTASQLTGTLQTAAQPNITSIGTLTNITIGSNTLGNTEAAYLTSIAAGTAAASKVLVLDSSRDITNIRDLTAANLYGIIQTSAQTNITSVGTLSQLTVNGATVITSATDATSSTTGGALTIDGGLAVAKAAFIGTNLTVGGNLIVSGTTTTVNSSTVSVKDNIILLNSSPAGSYDGGIIVQRYQPISNTVIGDVVADTAKETTTVSSATSNTVVLTAGNVANNYYNGWWIKINSDIRYVSAYVGSTKTVTVSTTFSSTPTASTSVSLYNRSNAAFTWNESNKQFAATYNANDSSTTLTTLDYADMKVAGLFTLNPINISDATESSSTSTGSIITLGGVGIAKALRVGNGIYGTIQTAVQTSITSVGTLTSLVVSGSITTNGAAFSSTEINYLLSLTPGTATASKALVLDSNSNISGIASMSATSVTIGGNVIGATQSAYLTGISVGAASAGKALVVDSNLDIASIRYLTATHLTGTLQTAAQPNITSIGTLTNLTIGSSTLNNTEAAYLTSITTGTASASKALVVNADLDIQSIRRLHCTTLSVRTSDFSVSARLINAIDSSVTDASARYLTLGKSYTTYNSGEWGYYHTSDGSTSNRQEFGFFGADGIFAITAGRKVGINNTSPAFDLDVTGSINLTSVLTNSNTSASTSSTTGSIRTPGGIYVGADSVFATQITIGSSVLTSTNAGYLTSITPGTASASKALVLDSSKNISGIGAIANSYINDTSSQLSYQTWTNGVAIPITVNLAISNSAPVFGTSTNHKMRFITNATVQMWMQTSGNVSIGVDDDTYKLNVNGSLNATSYYSSGTLVSFSSISGVTAGTASASKALILDASTNITGINSVGTTTLVLGGNSLGATQSGYITGVTAGTATAGKALIVDGSVNIAGINSLSTTSLIVNGTDVSAAITASGYVTGITPGTGTASKALVLDSSSNITIGVNSFATTTLVLGGNSLGATESAYLTSITAGTAAVSKALIVDSSRNIVNINALTASQLTGTLQTAAQTNITSVGTLTGLTVSVPTDGGISLRRTDASTTSIAYPLEVCHYLTGSVAGAIGVGAGMTFNAPNGSGTIISYGRMYAVSTAVTAGSHVGGLRFSTVFGGAFIDALTLTSSSATNSTLALDGASSTISATNLTGTLTTAAQTAITSVGTLTSLATGNITLNGTLITSTAAQLNYVSGVTAGTSAASKAVVLDASKNIAGVGSIGLTGENVMLDLYAATASNKSAVTLRNDTRTIEYGIMGTTAAAKANMFYIFNNAAYALLIDSNSNIGIGADPNSSYKLNTTTLNATSYYVSGSLVDMASVSYLSGITAGTVSASKAVVVDASSNITSGLNSVTMSTLVLGSTIISSSEIAVIDGVTAGTAANNKALVLNGSGSITGITSISTTTITIGGSQLDGTEAGYLDSVVAGTAAASKALVLNASSNITTGINSLTMTTLVLGSNSLGSTEVGYLTSITTGTAAASKALVLNSSSNITTGVNSFATTTLVLGGNSLGATESAYLTSITAGTAAASKALVLNSSSNITSGLNSLTATSLVTTNFTLNGTLVSVTGTELNVLGSVTAGTASASKALVLNSSSNISGINSLSSSYLVIPAGSTRNYTTGTQSAVISSAAITYNNTSVAGTDSTTVQAGALFIAPTYTATNAITTPIAATLAITGSPVVSTNQTITAGYALYITSGTTYFGGSINVAGTVITTSQLGVLAGVTAGTVSASKVMVVDSSSNIASGLNSLTATSLVTTNFNLGGTAVTATAAQLNFLSGVTAGTADNSKALVLNSSGNITTGLNSLSTTSLVTTNFSLGGTVVTASAAEINVLTGATAGTAVASKALVLDGSLNIATINSLTATSITGTLQTAAQANITSTGNLTLPASLTITNGATPLSISNTASSSTFRMTIQGVGGDQDIGSNTNHNFFLNSNNIRRVRVDAAGDIDIISHNASTVGLKLGGTLVTASAAELNYVDTTAGIAAASKAVVLDSSRNISNINAITTTGLISSIINGNGFAHWSATSASKLTSYISDSFDSATAYFGTSTVHDFALQTSASARVRIRALGGMSVLSATRACATSNEMSGFLVSGSTVTNNYTAISSTDSTVAANLRIDANTLLATNTSVTTTNAATLLITAAPTASTNMTITNAYSLYITSGAAFFGGNVSVNSFTLGGTAVTASAAELNYLDITTTGTAQASKALVLDSSSNITGINNLAMTGILTVGTSGSSDNRINFKGVSGDTPDNFTVLAERLYNGSDISELLLFKGNDLSTGVSGPDRIRLRAPEIVFQIAGESYAVLADSNTIMAIRNDNSVEINTLLSIGTSRTYASSAFGANINVNDCTLSNSYTAASGTDSGHFKKISVGVTTLTTVANTAVTTTNASSLYIQSAPVAGTRMSITNAYALYVNSGTTYFGGSISAAGTVITTGQLGVLSGVTAGTAQASKALVLNSSSNITSGLNSLTATTLTATGSASIRITDTDTTTVVNALDVSHYLSSGTAAIGIGSAMLFNAPNNSGSIITYGKISAISSSVTAGSHAGGFVFSSTFGGSFVDALTLTSSSSTNSTLTLAGASSTFVATNMTCSGTFTLGGSALTSSLFSSLSGVTAGTAAASKALIVDANIDIGNIRNLTATGNVNYTASSLSTINTVDPRTTATSYISLNDCPIYLRGTAAGDKNHFLCYAGNTGQTSWFSGKGFGNPGSPNDGPVLAGYNAVVIGTTISSEVISAVFTNSSISLVPAVNCSSTLKATSIGVNSQTPACPIDCGATAANMNLNLFGQTFGLGPNNSLLNYYAGGGHKWWNAGSSVISVGQGTALMTLSSGGNLSTTGSVTASSGNVTAANGRVQMTNNGYGYSHFSGSNGVELNTYADGSSCSLGSYSNHAFGLYANNSSKRLTVQTNGQIAINSGQLGTNIYPLHVSTWCTSTEFANPAEKFSTTSGGTNWDGTQWGNCSARFNDNIVAASFIGMSDIRIKTNIEKIPNEFCKEFIMNCTPVSYNLKKDLSRGINNTQFGYIAQDLEKNGFHYLVTHFSDDGDENLIEIIEDVNGREYKSPAGVLLSVSYTEIIPLLATNIKTIYEDNEKLETRVNDLEEKNKTLLENNQDLLKRLELLEAKINLL